MPWGAPSARISSSAFLARTTSAHPGASAARAAAASAGTPVIIPVWPARRGRGTWRGCREHGGGPDVAIQGLGALVAGLAHDRAVGGTALGSHGGVPGPQGVAGEPVG